MSQSRRDFLKTTTASMGAMALKTRSAPGSAVQGANDRILVGMIGVGVMGNNHLRRLLNPENNYNCKVIAVNDVYQRRIAAAREACQGEGYSDYRKLLENPDVDAVFISTPDHWHAKMAIDAINAGKHVYLEKPMTLTIEQALAVRDAVRDQGKVLQVGPGRTSRSRYWKARKMIREGRVGKVTWAEGGYNRNVRDGAFNAWYPIEETAGPAKTGDDYIDWDMWLGHEWGLAPKIDWNPDHFFRFRKYWAYSGGVASDLLYHVLAPLLLSISGPDGEYPHRASANGGLYLLKDGRDIPDVFIMNVDYRSEFSVNLVSVLTNDMRPPHRIYGQYGTIDLSGNDAVLIGNGDFVEDFQQQNDGYKQVVLTSDEMPDLRGNFFDVIRQGGTLYCNAELGATTMVAIKMAVEAYRQQKTLIWDAEKEQLVT